MLSCIQHCCCHGALRTIKAAFATDRENSMNDSYGIGVVSFDYSMQCRRALTHHASTKGLVHLKCIMNLFFSIILMDSLVAFVPNTDEAPIFDILPT